MITGIVALEQSQGIGYKGSMPWPHLNDDLKFFKEKTLGNIVVMGRKTWESIGSKNLPSRVNIVISSLPVLNCHKSFINTKDVIPYCQNIFPTKEIFIIGGRTIYDKFLPVIDKFYITEIEKTFVCDTYFNYNFVKDKYKNIKIVSSYTTPVPFSIKEYSI